MKTYNVVTGTNRDQSTFLLGHTIGKRLERFESLIVVVADQDLLPSQLRVMGEFQKPCKAVAVCHGVSRVDECIEYYKSLPGDSAPNIHIVYWMPAQIKYKQDADGWMPVEITSDLIKRQIARADVSTITLFVE
jgi:hypothetical protein